jgi:hypothetical protein
LALPLMGQEILPPPKANQQTEIYRFDPSTKLIPVPQSELKPGMIYRHYSSQLGRMVWSYLKEDRTFWHAFGPGTTQPVTEFDFRATDEQIVDALKKIDPKLAFDVTSQGSKVFLRLEPDETWKLVRTNSVPSILNAESGERWEFQWDRYVPVVHVCGNYWQYRDGRNMAPWWHVNP